MSRSRFAVIFGVCCLALLTSLGLWRGLLAEGETKQEVSKTTQQLGGGDRYLTAISTNKSIYKPGETMFMRAVVLHHTTRKPLAKDQQSTVAIEIKGPKGDVVAGGQITTENSVAGFSWNVPEEQAGGEYTIHVMHPHAGHAPAERKFDIRNYQPPRLKTQIKFVRDGYGPGDEVVATLETKRAEGGIPTDAKVGIVARLDGEEIYRGASAVNAQGKTIARFELPTAISRGEGTLALTIEDGGVVETASKTIPILLQTVDLTMYPEGGELVAGLSNRVYFEAFTPVGKPADLAGDVIDSTGKVVAKFRSEHEGRGRFEFTPELNEAYTLKITEPSGIDSQYPLPKSTEAGVVIQSKKNIFAADEAVGVTLGVVPAEAAVRVAVFQREIELAANKLKGGKSSRSVEFTVPKSVSGVLRVTAFNAEGKPVAERLVYRQPADVVNVEIIPDAKQYTPGGKASLKIKTTNAQGEPVAAVIGVTATDDSVLEMVEKREQAPRLPVMVFLEPEVKDLADAHVYLDSSNELAPMATDLLLGTQGWRRFALVDLASFLREYGDQARRASAMRIAYASKREMLTLDALVREKQIPVFEAPDNKRFGVAVQQNAFAIPKNQKQGQGHGPKEGQLEAKQANGEAEGGDGQQEPGAKEGKAEEAGDARQPAGKPLPANEPFPAEARPQDRQELREALEQGEAKADADKFFADEAPRRSRQDFVVVRLYSHHVRKERQPNERTDFTETLFWSAALETNDKGEATVEFGLNDAVTTFRISADAFSAAGAVGAGSKVIDSVEPFYVEPKLPIEVTAGDTIRMPIALVNATGTDLGETNWQLTLDKLLSAKSTKGSLELVAGDRVRELLEIKAQPGNGVAEITLEAHAGSFSDRVTRSINVRPQGFPVEIGSGGLLEPDSLARHEVNIPADIVPGSFSGKIVVYPTPLASMNEALARLIREPNGCFEQTSSSTYPLVMAQQYFKSHQGVDPALISRSEEMLAKGYDRLIGFESKNGGYEWFGGPQGHDALTAYGLMEFTDMAKVRAVDPNMLDRTAKWLLAQRDGKGGYERKTQTLHTWITDPECAGPYNTWGLLQSGVQGDLSTEAAYARQVGEKTENTYAIALAACVVGLAGDKEGENHLLDKLAGKQTEDGSLKGATTSVVGSGGDALKIEATSLAVLAWLNNPSYASNVEKSIKYLAENCKAGRFGSTQSTILALKAIVAYDASRAKPKAPGSVQLVVDGEDFGDPVAFTQDTQGAIELPTLASLQPGDHSIAIRMSDGSRMPYSIALDYHRTLPDSSEECAVHLDVKLSDESVTEGDVVETQVAVANRTGKAIPNPVAIIGLPGSLQPRHDQLKELVKAEKISAYEVRGREVVLYWRALAAEERVDLPISAIAAIPGEYAGPASRAYLYYTDEHKIWKPALKLSVAAKK